MNSRRKFLNLVGASLLLQSCSEPHSSDRYSQADKDLLVKQRAQENANSGASAFGEHRYQGYKGLARLPWFELDEQQQLVLIDESVPSTIDVHCHVGMSLFLKPYINQFALAPRVKHLLDCDDGDNPCDLDLDVYVNSNFSDQALDELDSKLFSQGLFGHEDIRTQTMAGLVDEMDAMRVQKGILLPIKLGLPFGDNMTQDWRDDVKAGSFQDRLLVGMSVKPTSSNALDEVKEHADKGFKVLKLHPTLQRFYPDDPRVMDLYSLAQELGITIFFHGGRAGIEPLNRQGFAMPRHYEAAFKNFPNLNFVVGHAGARDSNAMLDLWRKYPNVYFGIHGQGLQQLDKIIESTNVQRLLFGSDWPFYHIATTLAKVLIVTNSPQRAMIRQDILQGNAMRLFGAQFDI